MTSRTLCFAVACLLAAAATVRAQNEVVQASLDITEFPGVVRENSNATFTCVLTGFDPLETIVNYHKAVVSIDLFNHHVTEQISQSKSLLGLYNRLFTVDNSKRFTIDKRTEGNTIIVKLNIREVKHEDNGWYSCSARHETYGTKYAVKQLEVYRHPKVRLSLNETVTGQPEQRLEWNDTLTFTEGDHMPIHCISEAIIPIPSVEILMTDQDKETINPLIAGRPILSGLVDRWRQQAQGEQWRDVKGLYLLATEDNIYCASLTGIAGKGDCPLHFDYNQTATPRDLKADWRYDEKQLTCLVTMRDFERNQSVASVTLNVQYQPKLNCQSVTTGLKRNIGCIVTANPRIGQGADRKVWTEGPCSQANAPPITTDSAKYLLQEQGPSGMKNITLILQFKNATNLNQKFCLRVTNDLGTTSLDLSYKDPGSPHGAASALTSSGLLLAAAVLLLLRLA
jgi:hypothetical protein